MQNNQMIVDAKFLSPKRNSTTASSIDELSQEQLSHFGIDIQSESGHRPHWETCNVD
jgi:hypothetical protein